MFSKPPLVATGGDFLYARLCDTLINMLDKRTALIWVGILVVIGVAAWFRFYNIKNYPPGLFPDQAANGEDALLILDGDVRPFYPRGNGREGLFFMLQAASIKLFGIGVWPMFAVSALVGTLTVAATYFATRVWFGRLAGLLAALFLATSHWHVTISRTGFRAILIPLFVAAFTAFVGYTIVSVKKQRTQASLLFAGLAGAAFAGGFYTYIAYRMMVGVVLGIVFLLLLAALHPNIGFPHVRRYGRQAAIGLAASLLVFLPLAWYFTQHPDAIVGRAGQVSVFSRDLQNAYGGGTLMGTIAYSTRETLLSFFAGEGDLNWRHNVAGYPLLNPLVGLLFLLGFAWAINGTVVVGKEIIKGQEVHLGMVYPYLILLLLGMLVPIITTAEGMPHGLRSVGLVVPIFILAGTAGAVSVRWIKRRLNNKIAATALSGLLVGVLVLFSVYDWALYFYVAANDSEAAYAYRADLTDVSNYINEAAARHPDMPRPYLVLDKFSVQTVHFLTSVAAHDYLDHPDDAAHKYSLVDPASSHQVELNPGEVIIFTQSTIADADRYQSVHQTDIELVESRLNRFGQEIMRIYRLKQVPDGTVPDDDRFDLDA